MHLETCANFFRLYFAARFDNKTVQIFFTLDVAGVCLKKKDSHTKRLLFEKKFSGTEGFF